MPDSVEIYMALPGQKLEDGQMTMSNDIDTRDDAKYDAEQRCANNPAFEKVVYYTTSDDGDFKTFFSYKNPNVKVAAAVAMHGSGGARKKKKVVKKAIKKSAWQKFRSVFEA
jgi:hypothetical protein